MIDDSSESAEAKFQQAFSLHQQGRLAEARNFYEQVLRAHPAHFNALHLFGVLCLQSNLAQPAADLIANALRVNPNHALAEVGREAEAIASFEAAVGIMPNNSEANTLLGHALRGLRRFEAAFLCYDRAVALDVNYAAAYNGGGLALFTLRRFKEAIAGYDKAIASSPANAELHFNRAQALDALGRHAEAILSYDQTLLPVSGNRSRAGR